MNLVRIEPGQAVMPPGAHPDLDLARAVLRKDRKATAEFVEKLSGPVYSYIRGRLFPRADAVEDTVQEVFVAAWQYLPGYRGTSPLAAWIMGIARHKVEDHYRRRLREFSQWDDDLPEPADAASPPLDELLDSRRLSERMRSVLAGLPEHYAAILLWRYWEQRSSRDIAEATGRTEKSVERLLARARENFKRGWQDA